VREHFVVLTFAVEQWISYSFRASPEVGRQ